MCTSQPPWRSTEFAARGLTVRTAIYFVGRLIQIVEAGHTTMRLYEWADLGRLLYLVHVEEDKPGWPPRRTLYPFINTHSGGGTPRKGYTAEEVISGLPGIRRREISGAYLESRANEVGATPERGNGIE